MIGLVWGSGSDNLTFNAALWFLPCLFVVSSLFIFIYSHLNTRENKILCCVTLIATGAIISAFLPFRLPWGSDVAFFALLFFGVGYCWCKYLKKANGFTIYFKVGLAVVALAINIPPTILNGVTGMASVMYGNIVLFTVAAISGSLFIIIVSQIVTKNKLLEFFGMNSLIIMCIHEPIRRIVIKILSVLAKIDVTVIRNNIGWSLLCMCIVAVIVSPMSIFISSRMKWMLGIRD